jgi:stearoyl-CoA desaturase (delta-9 desaturase)
MQIDSMFKYRFMWTLGVVGLFGTLGYTVYSGCWGYWLLSYVYFRCLWFFTNNIGLHRYFSHRGYKTGPKRHKFLAWITVLAGVGSPFTWTIHHRHHHRYSDKDKDLHSPHESSWRSITGSWAIKDINWWVNEKQVRTLPKDLVRDPTVMFIHQNYYKFWAIIFLSALIFGGWQFCLFFVMQPVGWNLFHGALVNYFNHTPWPGSYRNYDSEDTSYNNKYIHWFLLGEGLHNNHHAQPYNISQAHRPGEFDPAAWVIRRYFEVKDEPV